MLRIIKSLIKKTELSDEELEDRMKAFSWYQTEVKDKKAFWIVLGILLVIEVFLGASMFFK